MKNSTTDEEIEEAQTYARIWQRITSRPFTTREWIFAQRVADHEREKNKSWCNPPEAKK